MKHQKRKNHPVKLVNPLNQETWLCEDYRDVVTVEGVDYIRVHSPSYANNRKFLMRKDALRVVTMG